jgi:hypothetical protein
MPATLSVNRACSRCPEVESHEVTFDEVALWAKDNRSLPPTLRVNVEGLETITFEHLCASCRKIVMRHLAQVGKKLRHRSSARTEQLEVE